jgi:hypothetical protein
MVLGSKQKTPPMSALTFSIAAGLILEDNKIHAQLPSASM